MDKITQKMLLEEYNKYKTRMKQVNEFAVKFSGKNYLNAVRNNQLYNTNIISFEEYTEAQLK